MQVNASSETASSKRDAVETASSDALYSCRAAAAFPTDQLDECILYNQVKNLYSNVFL